MKITLAGILLGILIFGCSSKDEVQVNVGQCDSVVPADEDQALVTKAANKLVAEFSSDLQAHLVQAMQVRGAVNAINVCSRMAPAIADSHSVEGWTIHRVSEKNRNPGNRATTEEKIVLAMLADSASTLRSYSAVRSRPDSASVISFYKPIYVQSLCLNCHGDIQTLAPGVLDAVKRYYPADRATGYKAGDLRGMFVVEVVWPEGRARAEKLVNDSL